MTPTFRRRTATQRLRSANRPIPTRCKLSSRFMSVWLEQLSHSLGQKRKTTSSKCRSKKSNSMSTAREHTIDSQGLPIHYLEWGDPGGEPLVLVHGFLDLAFSWQALVEELERAVKRPLRVIAPDCRGHGDSGWVGAGGYFHFPAFGVDLTRRIPAPGLTQCKPSARSTGRSNSISPTATFSSPGS